MYWQYILQSDWLGKIQGSATETWLKWVILFLCSKLQPLYNSYFHKCERHREQAVHNNTLLSHVPQSSNTGNRCLYYLYILSKKGFIKMWSAHQKLGLLSAAVTTLDSAAAFHLAFAMSKLASVTSRRNNNIPRNKTWAANAACQRRMVIRTAILLVIVLKAARDFRAIGTWFGLPRPITAAIGTCRENTVHWHLLVLLSTHQRAGC